MRKILLLDDDKVLTNLIKSYLEKNMFDVNVINAPDKLFDTLKKISPDVLIMDLMMPKIDGLSLLKKLRESEYNELPVLIISAKNYKSTILSCITAGASDFLPKPFTLDKLSSSINTLVH
jgi:DNA-binding response OmpR family regulator